MKKELKAESIEYISFFNQLKDNDTTLTTIDGVIFEFLKGSKNNNVYSKKEEHINDIIDYQLPPTKDIISNTEENVLF